MTESVVTGKFGQGAAKPRVLDFSFLDITNLEGTKLLFVSDSPLMRSSLWLALQPLIHLPVLVSVRAH